MVKLSSTSWTLYPLSFILRLVLIWLWILRGHLVALSCRFDMGFIISEIRLTHIELAFVKIFFGKPLAVLLLFPLFSVLLAISRLYQYFVIHLSRWLLKLPVSGIVLCWLSRWVHSLLLRMIC